MTEQPAIIYKTRDNAILPRDASSIARRPLPDARRPPLGLSIVTGPEDDERAITDTGEDIERGPFYDLTEFDGEHLATPVPTHTLYLAINGATSVSLDGFKANKKRIAEIEAKHAADLAVMQTKVSELGVEIARLTAKLAEATAKVGELAFVSERIRVEKRGPVGQRGERGLDGKDGKDGAPGRAALPFGGFEINEANLTATLVSSEGKPIPGATLRLKPLLDAYSDLCASDEDE